MFKKILVANRGEIALRIIRACREMGIPSVVVYSEVDHDSLPVRLADESVCIGPGPSARSYLNIPAIMSAALISGADALHPGCGFLSENAYLAEVCEQCNITFIGPPSEVLERLGDKASARQIARGANVPVMPGSINGVIGLEEARRLASEIGYPVILKAVAGGGGRGLRIVQSDSELVNTFPVARAEAQAAFSNGELYIEKYLPGARHLEIQILADKFGNILAFPERDCSIQRRHQKMIEEAPAPNTDDEIRTALREAALKVARAAEYVNAGTMEFLLSNDCKLYFMEANSRIQVEHPITEAVTGVDLVKWQIRIAAGERLSLTHEDILPRGHAIECRINAEDVAKQFLPTAGTIDFYLPSGGPGVRVDSHVYTGYRTPSYYDSLLAKLIVWGADRDEALARMQRALQEFVIRGIPTTASFHERVLAHPVYQSGRASVDFIEKYMEDLPATVSGD